MNKKTLTAFEQHELSMNDATMTAHEVKTLTDVKKELIEQRVKGFTVGHDVLINPAFELTKVAGFISSFEKATPYILELALVICPIEWATEYFIKLCEKPYLERLKIASSLLIKEVSRYTVTQLIDEENERARTSILDPTQFTAVVYQINSVAHDSTTQTVRTFRPDQLADALSFFVDMTSPCKTIVQAQTLDRLEKLTIQAFKAIEASEGSQDKLKNILGSYLKKA